METTEELAREALILEALRQEVKKAAWEARLRLEHRLIEDGGLESEDTWCDTAMSLEDGDIRPEFSDEGFRVLFRTRFEQWAVAKGFAHMEWVIDEEAALAQLDAYGGAAFYEGEEVPGVYPVAAVPLGVSVHPSKAAREIVKEKISEYLHQTAGNPA